jgi:hypothetical protein
MVWRSAAKPRRAASERSDAAENRDIKASWNCSEHGERLRTVSRTARTANSTKRLTLLPISIFLISSKRELIGSRVFPNWRNVLRSRTSPKGEISFELAISGFSAATVLWCSKETSNRRRIVSNLPPTVGFGWKRERVSVKFQPKDRSAFQFSRRRENLIVQSSCDASRNVPPVRRSARPLELTAGGYFFRSSITPPWRG